MTTSVGNFTGTQKELQVGSPRQCWYHQKIILSGKRFGASNTEGKKGGLYLKEKLHSIRREKIPCRLFEDSYSNCNNSGFTLLSDKMSKEHATEIDDIKSTVHKLFVALHLEEHQTRKEKELMQKMELLKEELFPLEQV